jgi:hypothetical protein
MHAFGGAWKRRFPTKGGFSDFVDGPWKQEKAGDTREITTLVTTAKLEETCQ